MLRIAGLFLVLAVAAHAQSAPAQDALKRFKSLRPGDEDLAMYRLDWASDLAEAKRRAAKDRRPLLLVVIHAKYGDMITGHC